MSGDAISTELLGERVGVIGHIKIGELGEKRTARGTDREYQLPRKLDHFRVTTRERGPDGNFIQDDEIHRRIGDQKPTELDFRLLFDEVRQNFHARMTEYEGRTCKIACDGEEYENRLTGISGPCKKRAGNQCGCKPNGRLTVILEAGDTFGGAHVFRSTSWETVANIQTTLRMLREQFGSLRGLPLRLKMYPAEVQYEDGGKSKTGTAWKVAVVLRATYQEAAQAALQYHRSAQLARKEILQLASGLDAELRQMDREEEGHVADEYFPEASRSEAPRIGRLNRALAPPTEEEAEIVPDESDEPPQVIRDLEAKLAEAREMEAVFPKQEEQFREIIEARDEARARAGIDYLTQQIELRQHTDRGPDHD